jgi:hypothetical protein
VLVGLPYSLADLMERDLHRQAVLERLNMALRFALNV